MNLAGDIDIWNKYEDSYCNGIQSNIVYCWWILSDKIIFEKYAKNAKSLRECQQHVPLELEGWDFYVGGMYNEDIA